MRLMLASLALTLAMPASATDLEWNWEVGQHRRYYMQAGLRFQSNMPIGAERKDGFQAQELLFSLITDCEATEILKKGKTALNCQIEDIAIMGAPGNASAAAVVQRVLDEWKTKLSGTHYETLLSRDGRVLRGELVGVTYAAESRRTGQISTTMELLVDRIFATLDLQLPKAGTAWEDGWIGKNSQSMLIPTASGGVGGSKLNLTVDAIDGNSVDILLAGNGTIMEGIDVPKSYAFESEGIARFDTETGALLAHAYRSTGELTASSVRLPGRQTEQIGPAAAGSTSERDPTAPVSVGASGDNSAVSTTGGSYDPGTYQEVSRMYLLADGESPDLGPTGPLLYPEPEAE